MSDTTYLRNPRFGHNSEAQFRNAPILSLLRVLFDLAEDGDTEVLAEAQIDWEGPDYAAKEFAGHIGVSQSAVYKWLVEASHFPAKHLPDLIAFIAIKSGGTDLRLVHYFADLSGYGAKVREIERILGR